MWIVAKREIGMGRILGLCPSHCKLQAVSTREQLLAL